MFLTNLAATPTTRGHNAQRLAALTRVIGDPQIHDVTPALLADYQARRREQVSQATLAYEAQVIFRLFRYLQEHGYITVNPAASLDRKEPRTSPGKEITYEEERKILLACTPRVRLRLLLGLDAGLRRGEMMGLRRRDWQKQEALLTVWRPKTRTSTTIPLTRRLSLALEEIAGHLMPDSFINSWGQQQVRKGTDALKNLRARTAVPFRLHDTRHTFATRLRRVAPFEVVRHLMGHAPSTVTERYIHPSIEDCRKAIERMEEKNPNKSLDTRGPAC
jgi:integrase